MQEEREIDVVLGDATTPEAPVTLSFFSPFKYFIVGKGSIFDYINDSSVLPKSDGT